MQGCDYRISTYDRQESGARRLRMKDRQEHVSVLNHTVGGKWELSMGSLRILLGVIRSLGQVIRSNEYERPQHLSRMGRNRFR
jgi:hypothetical protein